MPLDQQHSGSSVPVRLTKLEVNLLNLKSAVQACLENLALASLWMAVRTDSETTSRWTVHKDAHNLTIACCCNSDRADNEIIPQSLCPGYPHIL